MTSNSAVGNAPVLSPTGDITLSAWVRPGIVTGGWQGIINKGDGVSNPASSYELLYNPTGAQTFRFDVFIGASSFGEPTTGGYPINTWYFVTGVRQSGTEYIYVNGALAGTPAAAAGTMNNAGNFAIGSAGAGGNGFFSGQIADVQVYNTSLDANSVKALYQEGIGGAPINLQSLAAWYPLNENTNDYSGNRNNGAPTNVIYTNQWLGGYTVP